MKEMSVFTTIIIDLPPDQYPFPKQKQQGSAQIGYIITEDPKFMYMDHQQTIQILLTRNYAANIDQSLCCLASQILIYDHRRNNLWYVQLVSSINSYVYLLPFDMRMLGEKLETFSSTRTIHHWTVMQLLRSPILDPLWSSEIIWVFNRHRRRC